MTRKPREPKKGLRFSEAAHRYWLDGKPVPGVTTILGVLDKPALPRWAAKSVAEFVADEPETVDRLRRMGRDTMVDALRRVPWEYRDKAADRGTVLHAHAEALLNDEETEVEAEHVAVMNGALDFLSDWEIEPVLVEFACASRKFHWAGTGDLIAKYRHPVTGHRGQGVFDWKSSRRLYPETGWQLCAYGHAEFHGLDGDESPMPEADAAFGVHISDEGYSVSSFEYGPSTYTDFLTIRAAYGIAKRGRGDWRKPGSGMMSAPIEVVTP